MKKIENIIKKIKEFRKSWDGRYFSEGTTFPSEMFDKKIFLAKTLWESVENSDVPYEIKIEARKNLIINCVTALEVFMKDILLYMVAMLEDNTEILNSILGLLNKEKDKIGIGEAYKIFVKEKIELSELISNYFSFQDLGTIDRVFSIIVKDKFLQRIGEYSIDLEEFELEYLLLDDIFDDWRERLAELLRLRHDFVHQINFKAKIGKKRLLNLLECLTLFVYVTEEYIFSFINEHSNI